MTPCNLTPSTISLHGWALDFTRLTLHLKCNFYAPDTESETEMQVSRPTVGQIGNSDHVWRGKLTSPTTFSCVAMRDFCYISLSSQRSQKTKLERTVEYPLVFWSHDLDLADKYAAYDVINKPQQTPCPYLLPLSLSASHKLSLKPQRSEEHTSELQSPW